MDNNQKKQLIIVANRLPVFVSLVNDKVIYKSSPGGLASALASLEEGKYKQTWIGWIGGDLELEDSQKEEVSNYLNKNFNACPIFLSKNQINRFYLGFSNKILSPFFHYMPSQSEYERKDWDVYKQVNKIFADKVIEEYKKNPDSLIWIHDYQLMLAPAMIREVFPNAKIGFFLHIPFPSSELFQAIPHRNELLKGLLGSSIIGFHTYGYLRHFRESLLRLLGINSKVNNEIELETHLLKLRTYPISINVSKVQASLETKDCKDHFKILQRRYKGKKIILGIDRLDYTKGIPQKLRGFKRFLEKNYEYANKVVLVQIAVPSRTKIESYRRLKEEVEELVIEINEKFEDYCNGNKVIDYIYHSFPFNKLAAYYKLADIALITSLRDGMNLIAKEYVAIKKDSGSLILSEMAGATAELGEAIIINPWDHEQIAESLELALETSEENQVETMKILYNKVQNNDVSYWADSIIKDLEEMEHTDFLINPDLMSKKDREQIVNDFKQAKSALIILDYDGTLVEITDKLRFAIANSELLEILEGIRNHKNTELAIVSGRKRSDLLKFLGKEALNNTIFSSESGLWLKHFQEENWKRVVPDEKLNWYDTTKKLLDGYYKNTPGSLIEEKDCSLVWHYRKADPEFGAWQARELISSLRHFLADEASQVINPKFSVEIRPKEITKANIFSYLSELNKTYDFILAIGDDVVDEDIFINMPENGYSIKVGQGQSKAKYRLKGVSEVRRFLKYLYL